MLPTTTLAAILVEQRKPLVIAEIGLPDKLEAGQVLVKVLYSGICGSQLGEIEGAKGEDKFLPHLLGHEGVARVLAVGPGVRHVKDGDTVVMHWRKGRGIEAATPKYTWGERTVNAGWLTTFNQYAVVSENRLTAIPSDSDLEVAPLYGCAVTTGAGTIFNACKVTPGETVAVVGCGGVGLATINAAKIAGAGRIIAADPVPEKRALAMKLGATDTVDALANDAAASIVEMTGGGVDHAIEAVGRPASGELAVKSLRRGGTATILGMMPLTHSVGLSAIDLLSGKKLQGAIMGMNRFPVDLPRLIKFYMNGQLDLDTIIAERIPLTQVNEGFETMKKADAGRSVIVFGQ